MVMDICRRFELYNDFIPPTNEIHNWDYLAFGYIDGISVCDDVMLKSAAKRNNFKDAEKKAPSAVFRFAGGRIQ